jgi:integrase
MSKAQKHSRGVYERPEGSGVWWVLYYASGKRHREKAGRKSDAVALYQKRKADARRGVKLPELVPGNAITFAQLSDMAVAYAKARLKSANDYVGKARILQEPFGSRPAAEITPQEIDQFLSNHCKTPATCNRYRDFFSLAFRLGMENDMVTINPARLVRLRPENNSRRRFLSRDEYQTVWGLVQRDNPEQVPAFVVSVYTGMRWGEQFSLLWSQVDFSRKMIRLTQTKNGSARNVPLNSVTVTALEAQRGAVPHKPGDAVFPRPGLSSDCRWWFMPAIQEAKITDYTWHNNRHTFCSWQTMAGASLKEIMVLAGHKSITMSARYAHLSPEVTASASERMVIA